MEVNLYGSDVRFGSLADICAAKSESRHLPPGHVCFTPESGQMQCKTKCRLRANSGPSCSWITLWRYSGKYIVGSHRATNALKRKIANWFDVYSIFNRH